MEGGSAHAGVRGPRLVVIPNRLFGEALARRGFLRVSTFERGCLLNSNIRFAVAKTRKQDRAPVICHVVVSVEVVTGAGRHGWLYRVERKRARENVMQLCPPKKSSPSDIVSCVIWERKLRPVQATTPFPL